MPTCFVIQPFDQGAFDKRYEDVFVPAIKAAGLDAYRVDRDPRVDIPIDEIENGIRTSAVCLVDITSDNPNVWFELGYAIASRREIVLVCSNQRSAKFPFDVQHRSVIQYAIDSPRDFEELKVKINSRLEAIQRKEGYLAGVAEMTIARVEGLTQHEMATLATIVANVETPQDHVFATRIRQDLERSGYARMAFVLAIRALQKQGFLEEQVETDADGDSLPSYALTETAWAWLEANSDKFNLYHDPRADDDEEVPF